MTDLVASILILAAYVMACVGWWARHKQLDRRRAHRNRVRRINAYSMNAITYDVAPDRTTSIVVWGTNKKGEFRREILAMSDWPGNLINLDTHSRKVDAA